MIAVKVQLLAASADKHAQTEQLRFRHCADELIYTIHKPTFVADPC